MSFKVGDRVYFDYYPDDNEDHECKGFGVITGTGSWHGDTYYDVKKDGDTEDMYTVEPYIDELIVLESVYNSPLYKALA